VIGASGFIGRRLSAALRARGDEVIEASLRGDPAEAARRSEGSDAIVNLAGEPVAQRWTREAKERIAASRIERPRALITAVSALARRPGRYISASAIGYYGMSESETFTEASPPGSDFLARVCIGWEREAQRAAEHGMRVTVVRTGLALGRDGGVLARLLPIFELGGGGVVASGRQWYSWVHVDDAVGLYLHALDGGFDRAEGSAFNAVAPNAVRNREFTQALAAAVRRPALVPVPEVALRLLFGEGAVAATRGQHVVPQRALASGYRFLYPDLRGALDQLVARR
jgi:uncharacterized protein (TIGR01777 family)